jgi:CRISPR-associated endonuclease/helicase Cas3
MPLDFDTFFQTATGHPPYDYQRRLAGASEPEGTAPSGPFPCESRLIDIPTGLGKTAAVTLAWLWNRVAHPDVTHHDTWPRRLVYCLPMRTLVEQTRDETRLWVRRLAEAGLIPATHKPRVVVLMGGENLEPHEREWDIHPERPAILIGTQDMLLSRALNRGYGMARARWPMHFGLLNNDALWVLDETQLMGVGVRTSAQLEGLRRKLGTALGCATWWASATLDSRLLLTPDHPSLPPTLALDAADRASPEVAARVESVKRLAALPLTLTGDAAKVVYPYIDQLASAVLARHQTDTTTLVILNRVDRAKDLCAALDKLAKKQALPPRVLVHSRFRPLEREPLSTRIKESGEKIIIATQAIEAGVDISARTLITELAPWSSLVQRFGRCNRKGEFNTTGGADILWINLEADDPKNAAGLALPYTPEQLATARDLLRQAEPAGASPSALEAIHAEEPLPETHLLRRKDLVDLFDTTPDLSGLDLDIARYIRDDDERDVQVFWRELPKDEKAPADTIVPERRELVRVAVFGPNGFKKFAEKNKGSIWRRDPLEGSWEEFRTTYHVAPGQIYLIDPACGGYSTTLGWTGEKSNDDFPVLPNVVPAPAEHPRDGQGLDDESQINRFQTLADHTTHVVHACAAKLDALPPSATAPWRSTLLTAARWHDVGKAHHCFQFFLKNGRDIPVEFQNTHLAKSPTRLGAHYGDRRVFRHELASGLAWLQAGDADEPRLRNLVAYLIATHHGKVRLSLRAMPGETVPPATADQPDTDRLHARGVWQGDVIPGEDAPPLILDGVPTQLPPLDLSLMRLGETDGSPSWTARVLSLRDAADLGLFRLAWLETLLRAADAAGSKIASSPNLEHPPSHDVAAKHHPVATTSRPGEAASSLADGSESGRAQHGLRTGAGGREPPSRDTRPDHATRFVETTCGILSYAELAPLLAERVQAVLSDLVAGRYAERPLDEDLLLELHARIAGDLVPEWAGRWRLIEVSVGRLRPPLPHLVPQRMRDFCLDAQARWPAASASLGYELLEFLAFIEGRFLSIHPFRDFNGRTIRLFLAELLRRLDLPPVLLVPKDEQEKLAYFATLEAADQGDYRPLAQLWSQRLSDLSANES